MKKKTNKRVIIRLYRPEVIELVDSLPRGFKSAVIEFALKEFLTSSMGRKICEQLKYRGGTSLNNILIS